MTTSTGLGNYAFLAGETAEVADDELRSEGTYRSASLLLIDADEPSSPFSHSQAQLLEQQDSSPITPSASKLVPTTPTKAEKPIAEERYGASPRADAPSRRREVNYEVEPTVLYRAIENRDWSAVITRSRHAPSEASTWVYRLGPDEKTIRWKVLPLHQVSQVSTCSTYMFYLQYVLLLVAVDSNTCITTNSTFTLCTQYAFIHRPAQESPRRR